MGLHNIFNTRWSGKDMTDEDRRKMFWYLKRKTSYTAWKREADAFDRFAEIFERQVIEEPHADGYMEGTDWDDFYPEILKAQVLFEKALAQLGQGDRSVFLYNSLGLMRDASDIAQSWYSELVYHGAQGDHFYSGKYVDDMVAAIRYFYSTSDDTGYLQPGMAGGRAPHFWGSWMKKELVRACAAARLGAVPEPQTPVLVKTGQNVPVFGIYEPQTRDGCMNYLLGDTPAPHLVPAEESDVNIDVTWRLLWEDKRYLDGSIPAEESDYFPPEADPVQPSNSQITDDMLTARSGTTCPKTGFWVVVDDLTGRFSFTQGDMLPQHKDREVTWIWVAR